MNNTQHYSTEQLVDYLEGRLDALASAELSAHLASGCDSCNESIALYQRMFSAIQSLHWKAPSQSAHKKVLQAYSDKYSAKPTRKWLPLMRPAMIGFAALMLIAFTFLFNLKPGVVYAGYVEEVTGQIELLDPTSGTWQEVKPGQSVPIDASVRSLADSQAVITFPGGEQTTLGSESQIHLVALTKVQGTWEISLEQLSGQTENVTAQKTHSFTVRTAAGIANSSNGHFVLTIKQDGSVVASVLSGEVETNSHSQKAILHAGESTTIPSESTTESPMVTDESLIDPSPNPSPEPSLTSTPTLELTQTPRPTPSPTSTVINPTKQNTTVGFIPTNSSSNSTNVDVNCSPGNSNGNGNSENASNSDKACK